MTTAKKLIFTLALVAGLMLLATGAALAAGSTIPHGGYDTTTDACLQCHDVHEAGSDYVLMRWSTVTDTCGSCHYLFLGQYPNSAGGSFGTGTYNANPQPGLVPAYDPGYTGDETRTTVLPPSSNNLGSRTSAYETTYALQYTTPGHNLQRGNSGAGPFLFADGVMGTANYIPGGFDQLTAIERAAYPVTVPVTNFAGTNGLYCASCHTPHGDFGQELYETGTSDTVNGKLLSGMPNHTTPLLKIDDWPGDGGKWCIRCHERRAPEAVDPISGDKYHNHPDTECLFCHRNDSGGQNTDFPHTGWNMNLLQKEPDALCIMCHASGLLP